MTDISKIQELLQQKADCQARIRLIPYDGTPEVKERDGNRYLYIRKRIGSRLTSTYVDVYSDVLYQLLLKNNKELRQLRKSLRQIDNQLAALNYKESELTPRLQQNLDFARANMKANIYDQAILEGVATTFPQTEDIIDNGKVSGMTATDVQKILNLKHAWEFVLDKDVIQSESNYYLLCHIAKLVNEGFFHDGGRIRSVPVAIGGCHYIPPLPLENEVKEAIAKLISLPVEPIATAISLCLYCMKTQIFTDGNKRAAVIFANHFLIAHGEGFLVIPEAKVNEFKKLLVEYYDGAQEAAISNFMKQYCWKNF